MRRTSQDFASRSRSRERRASRSTAGGEVISWSSFMPLVHRAMCRGYERARPERMGTRDSAPGNIARVAELIPVDEARRRVLAPIRPLQAEDVPLDEALGRVIAEDVVSAVAVPPVRRLGHGRLRPARGSRGPAGGGGRVARRAPVDGAAGAGHRRSDLHRRRGARGHRRRGADRERDRGRWHGGGAARRRRGQRPPVGERTFSRETWCSRRAPSSRRRRSACSPAWAAPPSAARAARVSRSSPPATSSPSRAPSLAPGAIWSSNPVAARRPGGACRRRGASAR